MNRRKFLGFVPVLAALPVACAAEPISPIEVDVRSFGAIGDYITDDTASIQSAIDFVSNNVYGGYVKFPPGNYAVTQLIAKSGVSLIGQPIDGKDGSTHIYPRIVSHSSSLADNLIYSSVRVDGFSVSGILFIGRGLDIDCGCIDIDFLFGGGFSNIRIDNCGRQAINIRHASASTFHNIYTNQCGSIVKSTLTGVLDFGGNDNYIHDLEIGGGVGAIGYGSASSQSLSNAAIVCRGSGNFFDNIVAEFGDIGFALAGSGGNNQLSNVRADNHAGHGFYIESSQFNNRLSNCFSHRCGHDADDTYDGFHLAGWGNQLSNCAVTGFGDANQVKHGFNDISGSGYDRKANIITNCVSWEHRTSGVNNTHGDRRLSYDPPFKNGVYETPSNGTINMDQLSRVEIESSVTELITGFDNGVIGQEVIIGFTNNNATIVHGGNLSCPNGIDIHGDPNKWYKAFKVDNSRWVLTEYASLQ